MSKIQRLVFDIEMERQLSNMSGPIPCKWGDIPPRTPEQIREDEEYAKKWKLPF